MKITSQTQFDKQLKSVCRRTGVIAQEVQALYDFATEQFSQHGNTQFLTALIQATKSVRAIRTATLEAYIMHHCAVEWKGTGKDKKLVQKPATKPQGRVTPAECKWFDFNNDGIDMPAYNVRMAANTMLTNLRRVKAGERQLKVADDSLLAGQLEKAIADVLGEPVEEALEEQTEKAA